MEITSDSSALLPPGDFARLDKRQKTEFARMQERMVAYLVEQANEFRLQFPMMEVHFAMQVDVYHNPQEKPATIRYSSRAF